MISQVASITTIHPWGSLVTPAMTPESMTPANVPNTLDLLVPWDIPLEYSLDDAEKQQIQPILQQLLHTLQLDDYLQALTQIEQLLATLPLPNTQVAQVKSTKTSLSTDDVDDYDQYFGVNHVQTAETALCLVRGLITNCHRFIALCFHNPQLSPQQVEQQKQGFISYIHLLARVFYLEELS
ncbi:MAG: hypothetical protein AAF959_27525 [Cyanobacteria bacterium P01_D01_bin.56]